jgi:streptomycin 6-kinase
MPPPVRHFEPWLSAWDLTPDGPPFATHTSLLMPVTHRGGPAMLKVTPHHEEATGAAVMDWWAGDGAARVLAFDETASLLERATGPASLARLSGEGADEQATAILCRVTSRLHAKDPVTRPPSVVPLEGWFGELWPVAAARGGLFAKAAETAERLLASQSERVVLHGDLHHDNVLDFGARGWLAIDPKGLYGERTFDYVNLLRNPEGQSERAVERLARRVEHVASLAAIDARRLLQWTAAFTGLSAAWIVNDGEDPVLDLALADAAHRLLDG